MFCSPILSTYPTHFNLENFYKINDACSLMLSYWSKIIPHFPLIFHCCISSNDLGKIHHSILNKIASAYLIRLKELSPLKIGC